MRDAQLKQDIENELRMDPSVTEPAIGVAVHQNGVVTLSGQVPHFSERWEAERATLRVAGVTALANEIEVRLPSSTKHTDTDIAQAISNSLNWNYAIPKDHIQAVVKDGWVSLQGEVDFQYQRQSAERIARNMKGVRGVTDSISIKPQLSAAKIKDKIEASLKRSAQLEADRIAVKTSGSAVTLQGTVKNWADRREAERVAWAIPGVTKVNDLIQVGL